MFSARVPSDLAENLVTQAVARRRASGAHLIDLTESNPTRVGLAYPPRLLEPLSATGGLRYDPQPFGLPAAREAVAADVGARGWPVEPARVVLTASTSEAYSFLFKLLCDAGDAVLVPQPSYPLFEHLTRLDLVETIPYHLEYHGAWSVDVAALGRSITARTRAVLVVSPNNPTGSFISPAEFEAIGGLCVERGLALISDEVFADYPLDPSRPPPSVLALGAGRTGARPPLFFCLGGLSKSAGLPQLKLGWMVVGGPDDEIGAALARLEMIGDTYLSVSTPVQEAAGLLIAEGRLVRQQIAERTRTNYSQLRERVTRYPACEVLPAAGGWSAVLRVPAYRAEERLVLSLVEQDGVLVHPGYFFDFPHEAFVVVSLLPEPALFAEGVFRVLERAATPG